MKLFDQFKDAILDEQKEDIALTTSYINNYPPKKLAQLGLGIINLQIVNIRTGLGGKTILELQLDSAFSDGEINTSTLRTGDIVQLAKMTSSALSNKSEKKKPSKNHKEESQTQDQSDVGIEAVVIKVSTQTISISVDESTDDSKILQYYNNTNDLARMWLVKLTNSITYKRMITTMDKVLAMKESDKNDIHKILLGESQYIPKSNGTSNNNNGEINFFNDKLNASQRQAIDFAINDSNITIIHGPPGTGKTYTLIELIQQLTSKGEKVLVCGPSNISVDTILERLGDKYEPMKLIRIGHPARLLMKNLQHSLEILSKTYGRDIINEILNDIQSVLTKIKKCKKYGERKALYSELKLLKKELRQRERKIVNELLVQAQVVVATLHGSGSYELKNSVGTNNNEGIVFDTIIIDEVSQSLEPQCWIPLLLSNRFKRLVIAGDNMQLPPTIKTQKSNSSSSSSASILATTLFDRLMKHCHGEKYKKLLDVQYRMNKSIMQFPSMQLYDNQLKCDDSVREISLVDLPGVEINDDTMTKCIWYDTQGGEFPEQISESIDGDSKYNDMELLVVKGHIKKLLSSGVQPQDIGVIAPYSAQVQNLKKQMGLGGEVVSSANGDKYGQLCVVGDLELMNQSGNKFLQSWSKFVEDGNNDGDVIFEIEYPNLDDYIEN